MPADNHEEESVTLPAAVPVRPGGLLELVRKEYERRGWPTDDLATFRMEGEDDPFDGLDDDDIEAVRSLKPDDVTALSKLKQEERDAIRPEKVDPRIREAREESAQRRRELKPWKDLAKKHGITWPSNPTSDAVAKVVQDVEAKIAGKTPPKPKGDPDPDKPQLDEDEIRNAARQEAERDANRKVVKAEVKVHARDLFAAPDDAPLYLDLDKYEVDDDGDIVDVDELLEDLKKVLKSKPHLAKRPGKPKPTPGVGERGEATSGADAGRAEAEKRFKKAKAEAQK